MKFFKDKVTYESTIEVLDFLHWINSYKDGKTIIKTFIECPPEDKPSSDGGPILQRKPIKDFNKPSCDGEPIFI